MDEKGNLTSIRPVKKLVPSKATLEGAGVRLRCAFGFGNALRTTRRAHRWCVLAAAAGGRRATGLVLQDRGNEFAVYGGQEGIRFPATIIGPAA
jgi:hypothetical protein